MGDFLRNFGLCFHQSQLLKWRTVFGKSIVTDCYTKRPLKTKEGVIAAALHNDAEPLVASYGSEGDVFTVSPNRFSQTVIKTIESDFATFEAAGSSHHRPARHRTLRIPNWKSIGAP